jgi:erythromycin esterase-like protein
MGDRGEWNVGQLMRDRYGADAFLVGMSTHLPRQFDLLLHRDETHALEPFKKGSAWHEGEGGEMPETYPSGI